MELLIKIDDNLLSKSIYRSLEESIKEFVLNSQCKVTSSLDYNNRLTMIVTKEEPIKGKYLFKIDITEPSKLIGTLLNNPIRETFVEQKVEGIQNGAKNQITKGTTFYVDSDAVILTDLTKEIDCDGLWSMTNKNPNLMPTLTITKIY